MDLLKLWKGLFYAMWSADKPRYQQALARDLASLTTIFATPANTIAFTRAFWETMSREWNGIEMLRMDKFLYLVRQFLAAGFVWLARDDWKDADSRKEMLQILEEIPLNARDVRVPNGLRYHVVDIYVDELDKADTERTAPIEAMLAPLNKLAKEGITKAARKRAQEALEDDRVGDWKGENVDEHDSDNGKEQGSDDEFGGFDD